MAASGYMLRVNGDALLVFSGEMERADAGLYEVTYKFTIPDTVGKIVVERLELLDEAGDVLVWRVVAPIRLRPKLQLQVRWNVDFRLKTEVGPRKNELSS